MKYEENFRKLIRSLMGVPAEQSLVSEFLAETYVASRRSPDAHRAGTDDSICWLEACLSLATCYVTDQTDLVDYLLSHVFDKYPEDFDAIRRYILEYPYSEDVLMSIRLDRLSRHLPRGVRILLREIASRVCHRPSWQSFHDSTNTNDHILDGLLHRIPLPHRWMTPDAQRRNVTNVGAYVFHMLATRKAFLDIDRNDPIHAVPVVATALILANSAAPRSTCHPAAATKLEASAASFLAQSCAMWDTSGDNKSERDSDGYITGYYENRGRY